MEDFKYNETPYPSYVFRQTHPDQLAVRARLLGLDPASVENCRILELGCGDGTNLNWIAHSLPNADLFGVDLSTIHIEKAIANSKELCLKNVTFLAEDVTKIKPQDLGRFDYIIAHGLFSWVPKFVRDRILELFQILLEPNGIGYISYNAYPGCHLRDMARSIMRLHVSPNDKPLQQVNDGVTFIELLRDSFASDNIYRRILDQWLEQTRKKIPETVFHDDFAEINTPFYFTEFAAELDKSGLQYLAEAEFADTDFDHLPETFQSILKGFGGDIVRIEQYRDFQQMRQFRQTLVVHSNIKIDREFRSESIEKLYISSPVKSLSEQPDLASDKIEKFEKSDSVSFEINHPLTKSSFYYLSKIYPHSVSFTELIDEVSKLRGISKENISGDEIETAAYLLYKLQNGGFVRFSGGVANCVYEISEKPMVSEFAVFQAKNGINATSLTGQTLNMKDELLRAVILLLDGKKKKISILTELQKNPKLREIRDLEKNFDDVLSTLRMLGFLSKNV